MRFAKVKLLNHFPDFKKDSYGTFTLLIALKDIYIYKYIFKKLLKNIYRLRCVTLLSTLNPNVVQFTD